MQRLRTLWTLVIALAVVMVVVLPGSVRAASPHAGVRIIITTNGGFFAPPVSTVPGQVTVNHYVLQSLAQKWEKAHPGVQIKFTGFSCCKGNEYYTVLRTQLTGGTAPDMFWFQPNNVNDEFYHAGLIADLTPYLLRPNKYIPGNKVWNDSFQPIWKTYGRSAGGGTLFTTVPLDIVVTGVFYNKTLVAKLGLHMPPPTWAAMIQDFQKVKAAGFYAFGENSCCINTGDAWLFGEIPSVFMLSDAAKYDVLTYHPGSARGTITTEEWARAVTKLGWRPSKDPGFAAAIRVEKDLMQYYNPGWSSADGGNAGQLWARGQLAFYWDITPDLPTYKAEKLPFAYGSFALPPITRATSPLAPNPPIVTPGIGCICDNAFAVSATAAKSSRFPLILDFLQYITAPAHDQAIVNEQPSSLPVVKGTVGDPSVASMISSFQELEKTGGQQPVHTALALTNGDEDTFDRVLTLYLLGSLSEHGFLAQADALFVHSAQTLIAQNDMSKNKQGTWDLTKW